MQSKIGSFRNLAYKKRISPVTVEETAEPTERPVEEEKAEGFVAIWRNRTFKLLDLWDYLRKFAPIFKCTVSELGVEITGMDTSHVEYLHITLGARDFQRFTPCPLELPLHVEQLAKKFKRFTAPEDCIRITATDADREVQQLRFECNAIHFAQSYKEVEYDETPHAKEFPWKVGVTTRVSTLLHALEFASDVSEFIEVKASNTTQTIRVQGVCEDDGTAFHRDLPVEGDATIRYACAMYSVQCLLEILRITKTKTVLDRLKVTLEYATGVPLQLTIPLTAHSQIRVLLAPRGYEEEANEVVKSLSALWGFLCTPLFFSQPREESI